MKRYLVLGCVTLLLAGCGGQRAADSGDDDLNGVRGFLQNAFAGRGSDDATAQASAPAGGGLCGDPMLVGEVIGAVPGPGSCGIDSAVRLTQVGDIRLSQPATINCKTARALREWVDTGVKPAVGDTGGGVASLRVAAHYVCRTRNHRPGARLSEHSFGNAIDISAINLVDGSTLTVSDDWRGQNSSRMRAMHEAACGPFGTVLGPNSDRMHQDHFHFDVADHRGGPYCR